MNKLSEQEKYTNLCRETEVVNNCFQFLLQGKYPGAAAQNLAVCQMYLQGLYKHLQAECGKLAPLPLPPLESNVEALPSDPVKASEPVSSEPKQETFSA